jgi:hypothetical protein
VKKYAIFLFLMSAFSAAYSQDVIAELKKLTLTNDSLQKELKSVRENSAKELQACKDSTDRLAGANKAIASDLNNDIEQLKKDTAEVYKQIKKLDKSNIKGLETTVQQKADSIKLLKDTINSQIAQISSAKIDAAKRENEKFEAGRQNVYSQMRTIYQNETFDDLIRHTTKESVDLDLQLVGDKDQAGKKLLDLQTYFAGQQMLREKYDEQNIKAIQTRLNGIAERSELLDALKKRLSNYKLCSDGLKTTIGKINDYDKKFTANDDYTQKTKLTDILTEFSSYFRNYYFNFSDYPHLSDIVLEIMALKQKDTNTDISALLSKL